MILILMATLLLISLAAALPNVYQAGQREREEELIFRGNQYARAILRFHQQFNRYPTSVKELLETNRLHFLRHAYRDPMSRSGKWRFIHADANGVPLDSKTLGVPGRSQPGGAGANQGQPASGPATSGQQGFGFSGGTPSGQGFGFSGGATPGLPAAAGQPSSFGFTPQNPPGTASSTGSSIFSSQVQETYIIGVASSSTRESIRVWNGHTHYDEWEFLATALNVVTPAAAQGVPAGSPNSGSGFPGAPPGIQGPLVPRPPDSPAQNQ